MNRINLNGIHEIDFTFPGTTTASIVRPGVVSLVNSFSGAGIGGVNEQTGTSYIVQTSDLNKLVTINNASPVAVTLPDASSAGFESPFVFWIENTGVGSVTITPTTSTIDGATTLVLTQNQGVIVFSDSTDYFTVRGIGSGGGGGGGTVTSVGLAVPSRQTVTGSPVTSSGTLAITDNAQSANTVFAGPATGTATPTFRSLTPSDLPVATTSALGAVKPDGSTITISGGVLSTAASPSASWGGGEAAFTAPVLADFTEDNFGTTGTSTVAESFTASGAPAIRLRERGAGGNTNHLRSLIVPIPTATSKWTVTARLRSQTNLGSWHDLGLVLKDSVSGRFIQYGWGSDTGSPFVYVTWANSNAIPASATADGSSVPPRINSDLWLQVYFDGTNLNFQYSRDGQYFITCKQTKATAYLTNPADWCGIGINPNNTYNALVETVLECFSFSVVNN